MPKLSGAERERRVERVLEGARRCFARYGYEGATVARLEQEIGLSRGAIFNWFDSKEALFAELARRDSDRLLELFADEGFGALVRRMIEEDSDWLAVYLEFGRRLRADEEFRERWKERSDPELRRRVDARLDAERESGETRDDLTREQIGRFLGLVLDGIVVQRGFGFEAPDADVIVRLVKDALRAPDRAQRASSSR